ncbi:MAG: class I SAM-dependent methyltransferase [Verrucomicrobia bacterium]|nr:class I SAM-dependent methyltransferase [Verrucomicrobiota bacterium]
MPNPFDDPAQAGRYEDWYATRGRRADRLEKRLLAGLLAGFHHVQTVLEVGCGTGHFTRWLAEQGFRPVGVDASPAMLAVASPRSDLSYVRGDALALPFGEESFDVVALLTTLEFVPEPQRALREAVRVARKGLLLGVLNRNSLLALRRRKSADPVWRSARFFSPRELARLAQESAGERFERLGWRTTLGPVRGLEWLWRPWGGFIGMAVALRPG